MILVLVEANAGDDPRQSTRASTRGSSTSASYASQGRPLSIPLDRKRKQIDDNDYPAIVSPFNSECLSLTTVAAPSVREWQFDSILEHVSRDELRVVLMPNNNWAESLKDFVNEKLREMNDLDFDEDGNDDWSAYILDIAPIEVSELRRGGELFILSTELLISVYKDLVAVDNNHKSEQNKLITYAMWSWRAHHHMQNHCQGKQYLVPKTGETYKPLRDFLNVMCGRETKSTIVVGERPMIGTPRYNLLLDIGMCPNPEQFAQLVRSCSC